MDGGITMTRVGEPPQLKMKKSTRTGDTSESSIPDFIELDTGATAWGTLEGCLVSADDEPVGD